MRVALICLLFFAPFVVSAQLKSYSFEEVDSLQNVESRPTLIFIHTDWCKYCQLSKNTTLKNDSVIALLNQNYYFVELNAEEKREIKCLQNVFKFKPSGQKLNITGGIE